jgi:predicted phage terminase large subunit-like protein
LSAADTVEKLTENTSQVDRIVIRAKQRWAASALAEGRAGKQIPPTNRPWLTLIFKSGRGFGKTRALCEWQWGEVWRVPKIIGHAVGPTISDMEGTLMKGPAGFQACIPPECLYRGSWEHAYRDRTHTIKFSNGSMIKGFGATDGGAKLRGPQCHNAIGDELREWDKPAGMLEQAYSNMELGVRLKYPDGTPSRIVCGTTPKSIEFLKNLYRAPNTIVVTGSTYENLHNLSPAFRDRILAKEGTIIGRVEIHAEDIDLEESAIFKRIWIKLWPAGKPLPEFTFILMSLDTAFEEEAFDPDGGRDKAGKIDYSACGVFAIFDVKKAFTADELKKLNIKGKWAALLCDFWMEKLGFPDLLEKTRETYRLRYGPSGKSKRPSVVLIENKASGISLRQTLRQYNIPVMAFEAHGQSKTMRAHAISPCVFQGMLFVPESDWLKPEYADRKGMVRGWAEPLVNQMCTFAGEGSTEYDDAVDCTTQAFIYFMDKEMLVPIPQKRPYPDADEKEEKELREAVQIAEREKRGRFSPYGS